MVNPALLPSERNREDSIHSHALCLATEAASAHAHISPSVLSPARHGACLMRGQGADLQHEAKAGVQLWALAHGLDAVEVGVHVLSLLVLPLLLLLLQSLPPRGSPGGLGVHVGTHCAQELSQALDVLSARVFVLAHVKPRQAWSWRMASHCTQVVWWVSAGRSLRAAGGLSSMLGGLPCSAWYHPHTFSDRHRG